MREENHPNTHIHTPSYGHAPTRMQPRTRRTMSSINDNGNDNSGDIAYLYGGYRTGKFKSSSDVESGEVLKDMWQLDLTSMNWSSIKLIGSYPVPPRSGCSMAVVKKRAYLFGGVADNDVEEDLEVSTHPMTGQESERRRTQSCIFREVDENGLA